MSTPKQNEKVEILVNGQWVPATFIEADTMFPSDPEWDEIWWNDYFVLEDGSTIPEDTTSGDELPEWRRPT